MLYVRTMYVMNAITTTLTTSGNSVAVRLPKELLRLSGLTHDITLQASKGKIVISNHDHPRHDWAQKIKNLQVAHADPTLEFADIETGDDLDDAAWDGPSFEDWQKSK